MDSENMMTVRQPNFGSGADVRVSRAEESHRGHHPARFLSWFTGVLTGALLVMLPWLGPDLRAVLSPVVATVALTLFYVTVLTRRQGHLPIFEAATFFVLATAIYTIVPLLQFALIGMKWMQDISDYRLVQWEPTPQQFGSFAWRHVLLLATFVMTYLLVRGKRLWKARPVTRPSMHMTLAIATIVLICTGYLMALDMYVGPIVSVYEGGSGLANLQVPHVILQIANVAMMVKLTLKQCLVVILLTRWNSRRWRAVLLLWLIAELMMTVGALESRTNTVLLLLAFVVGYHQIVKRISTMLAFTIGGAMLVGFLAFGLVRDLDVEMWKSDRRVAWSAPNEFQVLYANAYDMHMRKEQGLIAEVPRQLPFVDVYRLIPSQILPFYKWEPAVWYKNEVLELRDVPMGFMFGIVAQSVLGFDWIELFLRALLLALFYAAAHRVWRRYSASFWATVAYLFVLTWAYFAFRASSFEILYRLVYYLAPAAISVKFLTLIVSVPVRARKRAQSRV